MYSKRKSIALIDYQNLLLGGMIFVLNIHIGVFRCAENRENFVENRQIKVINYNRAFKLPYFRGYDITL
jgi:hypothetical protein